MRRPGFPGAVALALPVAVLAAYWPALRGGLVWDDDAHVTRPDLRSFHGLARIWTEPGATQQYYPVLHSAFWAEHRIWGDWAFAYHLANVALHLAATLLLYRVLRRLLVPGALLAAAVFALHPVCVETVAWISEQKNTLSAVFYLSAALAYIRFDGERRYGWYALGTALFGLALLSKSVTATLPAALLVILWWKRGRLSVKADMLPLLPWICMGAAAGAMTSWMERTFIGARGAAFGLGAAERFLVAGRALWFYLGKLLWPAHLVFVYPRWTVDANAGWQYVFPAAAVAALAALYAARNLSRGPLAAALLYAGTLFPALGFVNVYPFVFSFVADHFQYLAAAGMISAIAAALALAADGANRAASGAAAACLVALLAGLTWREAGKYRGLEIFYTAILRENPSSWLAHDNLGVVLAQRGQASQATAHYLEAMRLNPDYPEAYNNYGNVLAQAGKWNEAADAYAGALRVRPSFAAAEKNWGKAMSDAGLFGESELHFRNALRLQPDYADAHYGLANALANSGRLPEAVAEYREALRLRPDSAATRANLGLALATGGDWAGGIAELERALRAEPGNPEAHAYLGFALAGAGRADEAITQYEEALQLKPNVAEVHYNLAVALRSAGRPAEAAVHFEAAAKLAAGR